MKTNTSRISSIQEDNAVVYLLRLNPYKQAFLSNLNCPGSALEPENHVSLPLQQKGSFHSVNEAYWI
jgi:hypothetical protein